MAINCRFCSTLLSEGGSLLDEAEALNEYICTQHGTSPVHYSNYHIWFWVEINGHEYCFVEHKNGEGGISDMQSDYLGIIKWDRFPDGLTPENAAEKLKGWLNWL